MIMIAEDSGREAVLSGVQAFFGPETPLKEADRHGGRPYEPRPQQEHMAAAVTTAFENGHNLCVEAPTGVGKSFAYLVPAIYFARREKLPVVVSTETITLQEQLIEKDLPLLRKLMGVEFSIALAKGRGNYLCRRRLTMTEGGHQAELLPADALADDLGRLADWAEETKDGSLSDLRFEVDPRVWDCVRCEAHNCFGPKCVHFRECFYWQARKLWEKADILVANHALFLTDLKMKAHGELESGLLPLYRGLVIDEAHQLEDNAARHLGCKISEVGVSRVLRRLFDRERGRGLLTRPGESAAVLRELVCRTGDCATAFFNLVRQRVAPSPDPVTRVRAPGFVHDALLPTLEALIKELDAYYQEQEDENFKMEILSQLTRSRGYRDEIFAFLNMSDPESVYWVERNMASRDQWVTLYIAPLNVADLLRAWLFEKPVPVVLTSATLSVGDTMDYFRGRTGFTRGETLILDSPFDFARQVRIFIKKSLPPPGSPRHEEAISREIERYLMKTHGKAFVLFTSYNLLGKTAALTRETLAAKGIKLLVQGEGKNRSALLREFKEDIDSTLFGTTSFWMGVDVPGAALSNVIITKLPFAVPSEPLIEARLDKLRTQGRNGFMEYSLPEAVLRFKQGVGRLIRTKTDTGIVAILDDRVITKGYGHVFLDSLPPCPMIIE